MSQSSHEVAIQPQVPMSKYEYLFAPQERRRAHPPVSSTQIRTPVAPRGELPEELQEYIVQQKTAIAALDTAIEHDEAIDLAETSTEDLFTMRRAVGYYGPEVIKERGIDESKLLSAREQLAEADSSGFIDAPSFIITALSLARMRQTAEDPAEHKAASFALDALEQQPAELDKIRQRDELGPHTGELAVKAIMEHEPELSRA